MNETLEEMNSHETLIVLKWQFGSKVRQDVSDEELIQEVYDVFEQVDWQEDDEELVEKLNEESSQFQWDWQKDDERERPLPQFQIGNYEVWLIDEFVHAIDVATDQYAKLTAEDSEFMMKFLIGIGIAH